MAREVIYTFESWEALGQFIKTGADREPYDEVRFRDVNGDPMIGEQVLEPARQIERETGQTADLSAGRADLTSDVCAGARRPVRILDF